MGRDEVISKSPISSESSERCSLESSKSPILKDAPFYQRLSTLLAHLTLERKSSSEDKRKSYGHQRMSTGKVRRYLDSQEILIFGVHSMNYSQQNHRDVLLYSFHRR
jgi:hypothetical protein